MRKRKRSKHQTKVSYQKVWKCIQDLAGPVWNTECCIQNRHVETEALSCFSCMAMLMHDPFEIGFGCPEPYRWMVHVSAHLIINMLLFDKFLNAFIMAEMTKSITLAWEKKCIWKSRSVDLLSWWFFFFCWLLVFSQIQEMNWWPRKRPATCKSWRKSWALNHESEKEICTSE